MSSKNHFGDMTGVMCTRQEHECALYVRKIEFLRHVYLTCRA